jgi:hypothetical protein
MKYTAAESWAVIGARPRLASPRPVIVGDAAWEAMLPSGPREKPRVLNTARWKCFNWNMALGLGTMALVSAAGWAGAVLLVSSLLNK